MTVPGAMVPAFHSVCNYTDLEASEPASIDLACMLVAYTRPTVLVESGTYRGHMALALANVLRVLGIPGAVYTADISDTAIRPVLADPVLAPLVPYIDFHHGEFLEMLARVPDPIGFGYIDATDRTNPALRMQHASALYTRLQPGGLMLVDDTESPDWTGAAEFRAWARSSGLHLPQYRGLTIIQKD